MTTLKWSQIFGPGVKVNSRAFEEVWNGDETETIHGGVQEASGAGRAPRRPHDSSGCGQAPSASEPGEHLEASGRGGTEGGVLKRALQAGEEPRSEDSGAPREDRRVDGGAGFFSARVGTLSRSERIGMLERDGELSERRQCRLLGISRSSLDYTPKGESPENLALMRRLDELSLQYPFYGSRQMRRHLRREGARGGSAPDSSVDAAPGTEDHLPEAENQHGPVRTPCLPLSASGPKDRRAPSGLVRGHHVYPRVQRVFVPGVGDGLGQSVRPVVAVVQHPGQRVLCRGSGKGALARGPDDLQHGSGGAVHEPGVHRAGAGRPWARCSMDGRGRCLDNVFIERLWRSLKYEAVYLPGTGGRIRGVTGDRGVDGVLQRGAAALGAGWADPTGSSPREGGSVKSGHRSSGYALGSVESSLRLLRFAAALRVTRRSSGREDLSWPEGDFRPSRTGNDHLHHHNQAASWCRSATPRPLDLRRNFTIGVYFSLP